jgi:uncharacterized membrane protein YeaQ/YmgE (transglycosylase-associated protein family)
VNGVRSPHQTRYGDSHIARFWGQIWGQKWDTPVPEGAKKGLFQRLLAGIRGAVIASQLYEKSTKTSKNKPLKKLVLYLEVVLLFLTGHGVFGL